ncbi:aldose 1-epimerase [Planctomicrobium sp. SH664]|uniref:aldose 1-epimerase n=1 Tax=Planctomicrobium sp. SH664 TaxID=3448125 RepID=UPI003F5B81F7
MNKAIRIHDPISGATAQVAPALGFNCFDFTAIVDGQPVSVIDAPADFLSGGYRPSGFGIPILFPFPNRVKEGKFTFEGVDYQMPLSPGHPNTIHGFCYDRPWRVIQQTKDSVTGQFQLSVDDPGRRAGWPADFHFEVRYRVAENRLETQFRIENVDAGPLPWGLGTHAYFKLPFGAASAPENCVFSVPVSEKWELTDCLPTGRRVAVENRDPLRTGARFGTQPFDDAFTGWQSDGGTVRAAILDEKAGIELTQVCDGQLFRDAVVFTPPGRNAVCLEPYTCITDAINLQARDVNAGLNVLAPGQTVQTWIAIQVNRVLA